MSNFLDDFLEQLAYRQLEDKLPEQYESGNPVVECEYCNAEIYEGEEYYTDGCLDMCSDCYCSFRRRKAGEENNV